MMLNDRDNQYENHEESEYHFSDDEVNYEVEPDTATPKAAVAKPAKNWLKELSGSKRILLSLAVFFLLVMIVYKFAASSNPVPVETEIMDQPIKVTQENAPLSSLPQKSTLTAPTPPAVSSKGIESSPLSPMQNTPNLGRNEVQNEGQTQALNQSPRAPQNAAVPQTTPSLSPPSMIQNQPHSGSNESSPVEASNVLPNEANVMATMVAENDRLINQLEADYTQKMNDFVAQNKNQEAQLQSIADRVSRMESQINQLVQALSTTTQKALSPTPPVSSANHDKIDYSVQAIIPGRAWLKSAAGETLTVAEGDMIKEVGKVVKIDPYDGVVEINTGSKVISLSYGNGE